MSSLDQRLHAYRSDLADVRLKGKVTAERFVAGVTQQICVPVASVRLKPADDAMQVTQALLGEIVFVFDRHDGWAWIQLAEDNYVGYVRSEALSSSIIEPTHRIAVSSTFLYPKPDLKSQPALPLSLNGKVRVAGGAGDFLQIASGGFIYAAHLAPVNNTSSDFVAAAELFLNTPYLWGGKGFHGLDCSGLVQVALQSCGMSAPRDADMQEQALGRPLMINDIDSLQRGDFVFWDGHVGIMSDQRTLLHANGHHMMVVKEPLRDAIKRIADAGNPVTSIKRT